MLLDRIDSPKDLRLLNGSELATLAAEIRTVILNTISNTGGHLSSNLGIVELTLALHYVFNTPESKLIWDVGHQCYTHKLVTGRRDQFRSIRQDGGLSGFPNRKESPYDLWDTGHASNSISIAVGLAEAKKRLGQDHHVIAVIGDGSLTGGMSFEALNQAGHRKSDLIVILNDNEMSISRNVGALSSHLNRIMTGEFAIKVREDIKNRIRNLPALGDKVYRAARYMEEAVKGLIGPGILFEELGFTYVGPVDGHDIPNLLQTLTNVKKLKGPILIHVLTKKGKGYEPAEREPARFHGVSRFDVATGAPVGSSDIPSYTDVFGQTLIDLASADERVVAVTAAMCLGTGLQRFSELFPGRFYDIGIAEGHGVTFASALAMEGLKPFVAIYSTFLQRAYDQLVIDVCLQERPIVFALDRSGMVGQDGPTHHGAFDMSYLRHMPNMVVMAPKDENELRQMLYSAYLYERPVAIRYPRGEGIGLPIDSSFQEIPFGKWEVLKEGSDITLMACGPLVYTALMAASDLEKEGISCSVVNGRFVKPMDREIIVSLSSLSRRVLTLEENSIVGGFGSGILEVLSEEGVAAEVKRLGMPDRFLRHGSPSTLRTHLGLDPEGIKKTVKQWLKIG
jgi:1-deoxy-D-xylulose-5-phosphate synthase